MESATALPPSPLRKPIITWLLFPLRAALGCFVLFQIVFLFGYNLLDIATQAREYLGKQRDLWMKRPADEPPRKGDGDNGEVWDRATHVPFVGGIIKDWVEKDEKSTLTVKIKEWSKFTDWWARKSGQEQGWSLFAPDTVDWTSVVRVEARWDDDVEEVTGKTPGVSAVALAGGTGASLLHTPPEVDPPSRFLQGYNEPKDIKGYLRWGSFRWRRYEAKFEVAFRKNDEPEETYRTRWEQRAKEKVYGNTDRGEQHEIAQYLKWKFDRFKKDHPDLPPPRQLVIWSATWTIPSPDKAPRPWMWEFEAEEPLVRWRPARFAPEPGNLELYLHTEHRFENKITKPWLNPMPRSLD